jgi:hypothetical protein
VALTYKDFQVKRIDSTFARDVAAQALGLKTSLEIETFLKEMLPKELRPFIL